MYMRGLAGHSGPAGPDREACQVAGRLRVRPPRPPAAAVRRRWAGRNGPHAAPTPAAPPAAGMDARSRGPCAASEVAACPRRVACTGSSAPCLSRRTATALYGEFEAVFAIGMLGVCRMRAHAPGQGRVAEDLGAGVGAGWGERQPQSQTTADLDRACALSSLPVCLLPDLTPVWPRRHPVQGWAPALVRPETMSRPRFRRSAVLQVPGVTLGTQRARLLRHDAD